jgi:hypothetical protein
MNQQYVVIVETFAESVLIASERGERDLTVFGPFDSEGDATVWAAWADDGETEWFVRPFHPPTPLV